MSGSGAFATGAVVTGDLKTDLLSRVKFYLSFLSFSLSGSGNVFTAYLPIGNNLAFTGVQFTIPKTGYVPVNTASGYFVAPNVGNNKTIVDYIIFTVGVLFYVTGVFGVVYFLVFFLGIYLINFLYGIADAVSFNVVKDTESVGGNVVSAVVLVTMIGFFLVLLNFFVGGFLSSLVDSIVNFRNILGYIINFVVLSITHFAPGSFVGFINKADPYLIPVVSAILIWRATLKYGRIN